MTSEEEVDVVVFHADPIPKEIGNSAEYCACCLRYMVTHDVFTKLATCVYCSGRIKDWKHEPCVKRNQRSRQEGKEGS